MKKTQFILTGIYVDGWYMDAIPYATYEETYEVMKGIYEERTEDGNHNSLESYINETEANVAGCDDACKLEIIERPIPNSEGGAAKISFNVNNGGTLSLAQSEHDGSVTLTGSDGEIVIPAGDMVMLANHYRNCKEKGTPIVLDEYNSAYDCFIEQEVPFRIAEVIQAELTEDEIAAVIAATVPILSERLSVLDYDCIDKIINAEISKVVVASFGTQFKAWMKSNERDYLDFQVGCPEFDKDLGAWVSIIHAIVDELPYSYFATKDKDGFEFTPVSITGE